MRLRIKWYPKCPICSKRGPIDDHKKCHRRALNSKRTRKETEAWRQWSEMRGQGEIVPGAMPRDYEHYMYEKEQR